MKFHGITLEQGSAVSNLTVASGTSFPNQPHEGELFFRSDADVRVSGLYLYTNGSWDRMASTDSLTVPTGTALPELANEGDLFYLNTNNSNEGLYVHKNSQWVNVAVSSQLVDALFPSFETVNKNLKSYNSTLGYQSGVLKTITYTFGANSIVKTFNYTDGKLTSVVLSGDTPSGITLTKTLTYTGSDLTGVAYS